MMATTRRKTAERKTKEPAVEYVAFTVCPRGFANEIKYYWGTEEEFEEAGERYEKTGAISIHRTERAAKTACERDYKAYRAALRKGRTEDFTTAPESWHEYELRRTDY